MADFNYVHKSTTVQLSWADLALLRGVLSEARDLFNDPAQAQMDVLDTRFKAAQEEIRNG